MLLYSQQKFHPQQNGKKGHTPRHKAEVCYSPCFMNLYLMSILYCFLTSWTKCRRAMESDVLDKRPLFCTAGHCCALSSGAPTYASHDAVGVVLEAGIGCATYIYIYIYIYATRVLLLLFLMCSNTFRRHFCCTETHSLLLWIALWFVCVFYVLRFLELYFCAVEHTCRGCVCVKGREFAAFTT
ncbi:hypothetical protein TcYC6_0120970 [Trypanosoma cruzi]|nr:hypothetical protein TcYC6_0120970 [Trypanosoma cruzi]